MKKKTVVILAVLALAVALGGAGNAASLPMGGPSKKTPDDLPVVKLPKDLAQGPSMPAGNPHGTPPGKDKKPPTDPPDDPAVNKWAVVIGIADYRGRDSDLWHPDEDAKEMAAALKENYGFPDKNVRVLLNKKATGSSIAAAIDWLVANEDADSTVVFFYSGHGFRVADVDGWDSDVELDGYDEGIVSADMYGLPDGWLKQRLAALESQKVALAFGSCHSGGMFDDGDDLQEPGRAIASACRAEEYAWDYLYYGNTLWGKHFVDEGLLQGLADTGGDGASIEEGHSYARPLVIAERADSQPQLYDGFGGDLIP